MVHLHPGAQQTGARPPRPGLGLQDVPRPFGQHLPTTLCPSQAIWRLRSSPEGPHMPQPAGQAHLVWETPADESSPWRYLSLNAGTPALAPGVPPALRWPLSPAGRWAAFQKVSWEAQRVVLHPALQKVPRSPRSRASDTEPLVPGVSWALSAPITLRKRPRPSAWPVCLYLIPSTSIPIVVALGQLCFCTCPGRLPKSGPLLPMENTSIQSSRTSLTVTS